MIQSCGASQFLSQEHFVPSFLVRKSCFKLIFSFERRATKNLNFILTLDSQKLKDKKSVKRKTTTGQTKCSTQHGHLLSINFFAHSKNLPNLWRSKLSGYMWLRASAAMLMRSALFCGITQRRVVILYRRFGTTYRSHLQASRSPRRAESRLFTLEDGTDTLCRNVGIGLPLDAVLYHRRTQISFRLHFPVDQLLEDRVTCFYLLLSDHVRRLAAVVRNASQSWFRT
jgi:hypothetical protein